MAEFKSITGGVVMNYYNSTTREKCLAYLMTGGEAIAKGEVVCALIGGTSGKLTKVPTTGASHSMPVMVALTACSGDGQTFWAVSDGAVQVLPEAGVTAAMGNVLVTSTSTAGRVSQYSTVPVADHWDEMGHWLENGSGAGALTLASIHQN